MKITVVSCVCRNHAHGRYTDDVSTEGQTETTIVEEVNSEKSLLYFHLYIPYIKDLQIHKSISSLKQHGPKDGGVLEMMVSNSKVTDTEANHNTDQIFISDIISSTPELAYLKGLVETRCGYLERIMI